MPTDPNTAGADVPSEAAPGDSPAARAPAEAPGPARDSDPAGSEQPPDPVRRITLTVLLACALLFVWYLLADRFTPSTDQARVQGFIVPLVPEVSGTVTQVNVELNMIVQAGDVIFQIDPERYELLVHDAESALELAGQGVEAGTADVSTAQAELVEAQVRLAEMRVQVRRVLLMERKNIASRAEGDRARAELASAQAKVSQAEAKLEGARSELGSEGQDNPKIRSALAGLAKARIDLADTTIRAPSDGGITNLQVDVGYYAQAGQPLATFVSASDVWVEANMRENSLSNVKAGDRAEIVLDIAPGRVFKGEVSSIGYGVAQQGSGSLGELPSVQGSSGWLRDPQRFPVILRFSDDAAEGLRRAGGQADVIIYTGDHLVLNALGWIWIRLVSVLSYVY